MRKSLLPGLFLGGLALCMRLYYILQAKPEIALRADAAQYFGIAINVLRYGIFSSANPDHGLPLPDSYRGPGYPSVILVPLALFGDIGTSYWFILVLQAFLGAGVAVLTFLLARRWLSNGFAFVAGLLVTLSPHLIVQGGYVLTESIFGFLLVAAAFLTIQAMESKRQLLFAAAGAIFAAAALVNPMILPFCMLPISTLLFTKWWRSAGVLALTALLPPLLWTARDVQLHETGERSAAGRVFENVIVGSEPDYNRYYRDRSDPKGLAARERVHEGLVLFDRDRAEAYRFVLDRISERPLTYASWLLQKPMLLWAWSIGQGAGDLYVYPMLTTPFDANLFYRLIAALFFGLNVPIAVAAFAGSALAFPVACRNKPRSHQRAFRMCVTLFLFATSVYAVLNPDPRYANPFRPFQFMIAATLLAWLVQHARRLLSRSVIDTHGVASYVDQEAETVLAQTSPQTQVERGAVAQDRDASHATLLIGKTKTRTE